jgi:hypothetical protein
MEGAGIREKLPPVAQVLPQFEPSPVDRSDISRSKERNPDLRHVSSALTAHGPRAEIDDPDLPAIVAAWDRLPETVRAGIVAMVKAASGK